MSNGPDINNMTIGTLNLNIAYLSVQYYNESKKDEKIRLNKLNLYYNRLQELRKISDIEMFMRKHGLKKVEF